MTSQGRKKWIEVRDPYTHKLICRFDPDRLLLEYKRSQRRTIVDLHQFQEGKGRDRG